MTPAYNRVRLIPQIIAVLMLLWALNPENPYGYYLLLRIVLCGVCTFLAYRALKRGNDTWAWVLGGTAVLYNPIMPVHLTRETWSMVNIATVVMLVATGIDFRKALLKSLSGFSGAYTVPDSVTAIGDRAFVKCRHLTSVTIPDSVTSIGTWAFYGCSSLTSVTIPASVTSIGELAFSGCTALTSINVHHDNKKYASVGGVLFNKECTVLIHCPMGFSGVYNIPDSVHSIGDRAFSECTSLATVTIPTSVTSIGEGAFRRCTSLATVTIPASVTSICTWTFSGCTSLTFVTIPASVRSINEYAFYDCSSLTTVLFLGDAPFVFPAAFSGTRASIYYLPGTSGWGAAYDSLPAKPLLKYVQENGGIKITGIDPSFEGKYLHIPHSLAGHNITAIGDSAFRNSRSIVAVTIPNSVTAIGEHAFSFCAGLTSITIPNGVTSIGDGAFSVCPSLTCVTIPDSVTSIGKSAFSICSSLVSVTIPTSVTNISAHVFAWCRSLATVTIPDRVTSIGDGAFFLCTSLATITIPASVTSIGDNAFFGCSALASILFTGDAPTICSNDADDIRDAFPKFPKAFFNTCAKIYCRPGTSGWNPKLKEKMTFRSDDEFAAYVDKHPDETFCWMEGEHFEIVPSEVTSTTEECGETGKICVE